MSEKCDNESCSLPEQEPVDVVLYNDEKEEKDDEIDIEDKSKWVSIILDNTVKNRTRLQVLENYFELQKENNRENDTIEVINKITGIYQFSGSKILENFLYLIAVESTLSSFLKLECAKSLLSFEELEEGSDSDDDEPIFASEMVVTKHAVTSAKAQGHKEEEEAGGDSLRRTPMTKTIPLSTSTM